MGYRKNKETGALEPAPRRVGRAFVSAPSCLRVFLVKSNLCPKAEVWTREGDATLSG